MNIDLHYDPRQDRIELRLRRKPKPATLWLTRRLTLRLLDGWLKKLDAIPLQEPEPTSPEGSITKPVMPWVPPPATLPLPEQHAMLMAYDAPRAQERSDPPCEPTPDPEGLLVQTVRISLSAERCRVDFEGGKQRLGLNLNRSDAHAMLEALARLIRDAKWNEAAAIPEWLGGTLHKPQKH